MKRVPWTRLWVRRSRSVNLGDRGYLVDPENEFGAALNPDVVRAKAFRSLPSIALLGEPGIGKSVA